MIKIKVLILGLTLFLTGCSVSSDSEKGTQINNLGHYIEFDKLEKVLMSNNSGSFVLNEEQMEQIKEDLSNMIYCPGVSAKVGGVIVEMTIDGELYYVSSATNGKYLEVHREVVTKNRDEIGDTIWLYFKMEKVNLDNYKKEE